MSVLFFDPFYSSLSIFVALCLSQCLNVTAMAITSVENRNSDSFIMILVELSHKKNNPGLNKIFSD